MIFLQKVMRGRTTQIKVGVREALVNSNCTVSVCLYHSYVWFLYYRCLMVRRGVLS